MKIFQIIFSIFIVFALPAYVYADNEVLMDTLRLSSVDIVHRTGLYNGTYSILKIDKQSIKSHSGINLGDLLAANTSIQIQSNGSVGSASGAFIRGSNSYHTSVNWNGFPVGSPTLGTCDLSLINPALMQEITVVKSAQGSLYGNGSFGGSINLANTVDWNNRMNVFYNSMAGSFGEFSNALQLAAGNKNIQCSGGIIHHKSEGNFPYNDYIKPGNPKIYTDHNRFEALSVMQHLYVKLPSKTKMTLGFWMLSKNKELPSIMGSYKKNNEFQQDKSLKGYLKTDKQFGLSSLSYNIAYLNDYMHYTDKENPASDNYSVNSEFSISQLYNDLNFKQPIGNHFIADVGVNYTFLSALTNNYGGKASEHKTAFFGGIQFHSQKLSGNVLFRKEFHSDFRMKPVYSLSLLYNIVHNKLISRLNLGRSFRTPTLNDRYWKPGGNPSLLPESGWGGDLAFEYSANMNDKNVFSAEINGYNKIIRNIIQWLPDKENPSSMIWSPVNKSKAWIRGVEASVRYDLKMNRLSLETSLFYNYNISQSYSGNGNTKNYMPYSPFNSGSASLKLNYQKFYIVYHFKYTGKRYTDEANLAPYSLPGYSISNLSVGASWIMKGMKTTCYFRLLNAFNKSYQVVKAYPMPGRMIQFGLQAEINKSNNQ